VVVVVVVVAGVVVLGEGSNDGSISFTASKLQKAGSWKQRRSESAAVILLLVFLDDSVVVVAIVVVVTGVVVDLVVGAPKRLPSQNAGSWKQSLSNSTWLILGTVVVEVEVVEEVVGSIDVVLVGSESVPIRTLMPKLVGVVLAVVVVVVVLDVVVVVNVSTLPSG